MRALPAAILARNIHHDVKRDLAARGRSGRTPVQGNARGRLDKLTYTAANPVLGYLVERIHHRPGVNGLSTLPGSPGGVRRPKPFAIREATETPRTQPRSGISFVGANGKRFLQLGPVID